MILKNKLLEEDKDKNIFLMVSPESTKQIKEILEQIMAERTNLKTMDPAYYDMLVFNWRDKLLRYPIALSEVQPFVTFYGFDALVPLVFLEELKQRYREIELSCFHRKLGTDLPFICHYITKDSLALSYTKNETDTQNSIKKILFDKATIYRDAHDNIINYKAKMGGYLIYGDNGLQIIPPLINMINPYAISLRIIPVVTGISDLVEFTNSFLKNHKEKYPNAPLMEEIFSEKTIRKKGIFSYEEIDIVKGLEPLEGKDSHLSLMQGESSRNSEEDQTIDYHDISQIFTVSEGDLIAKKELVISGTDGLDIYGKIFSVKKGVDSVLRVDENIQIERYEKEFHYLARKAGIVVLKENSLSLEETMLIKGDVDFHTGNLFYEKNIHILGDVRSGFEVESQSNIIIEGTVEDNVQIRCKGTMKILKGIVGEKTSVYCKDDLICSFIERAKVTCLGNLTVTRYILGGEISSMGNISILGQGLSQRKVGALSGSICRCYQYLKVLSLGADANNTQIYLGYNYLVEEKLLEIEEIIKGMQIRVSQFMENIPFDLSSPLLKTKLRESDNATKDKVRSLLVGIKNSNKEIEELQTSQQELMNRRYTEHTNNFSIECKEGIKGPTIVYYNNSQKKFPLKEGNFKIRYNNFEERLEMI